MAHWRTMTEVRDNVETEDVPAPGTPAAAAHRASRPRRRHQPAAARPLCRPGAAATPQETQTAAQGPDRPAGEPADPRSERLTADAETAASGQRGPGAPAEPANLVQIAVIVGAGDPRLVVRPAGSSRTIGARRRPGRLAGDGHARPRWVAAPHCADAAAARGGRRAAACDPAHRHESSTSPSSSPACCC